MQRIHVAYILDQFGTGGTENQLKLLMEGLDRSRFRVSLYLLRGDAEMVVENVAVHRLGIDSIVSIKGVKGLLRLSRRLRRERVDILQTFMQDATIVGVLAARISGLRNIVVSIEDMLFWATPVKLAVHKLMVLLSHSIRVNSHAIKESIGREFFFADISVIHNGIPTKDSPFRGSAYRHRLMQQLKLGCDLPIVVIVSNLNRRVKRVDLFVEAAAMVLKKIDALFVIVGDGALRIEIEAQIERLNSTERIVLMGQRRDVAVIYAGADLAANTSDSEGLANSVIEGMRAGLPIIASDVPGNREALHPGRSGWLFAPNNSQALAEAFEKALGDPKARMRMGLYGRWNVSSNYQVTRMVQGHERLYRRIVGKGIGH